MKFFLVAAFLLFQGCSSLKTTQVEYVKSYQAGAFDNTDKIITSVIDSKSNDSVQLLLDRGLDRLVADDADGAIEDFQNAITKIDYFNQKNFLDTFGQVLLQDDIGPYTGDDYEQLLARLYFAIALLHKGDYSNAYALLRQAEEWTQMKNEDYQKERATCNLRAPANPLGKYLFAALLEKRGDYSNAEILYKGSGLEHPPANPNKATVLVVCHNGLAPHKITEFSPASQASAFMLEILLGASGRSPALSTLPGIPTPALVYWPASGPSKTIASLDCQKLALQPIFNVSEAASIELAAKMPLIVARGVARLVLRRSAVMYAQEQDPNVGALCDIGMLILNAAQSADTRSWSLLPRQIEVARFDVDPGVHSLSIEIILPNGQRGVQSGRLKINKSDLAVINVFNITPGNSRVLIPEKFQE